MVLITLGFSGLWSTPWHAKRQSVTPAGSRVTSVQDRRNLSDLNHQEFAGVRLEYHWHWPRPPKPKSRCRSEGPSPIAILGGFSFQAGSRPPAERCSLTESSCKTGSYREPGQAVGPFLASGRSPGLSALKESVRVPMARCPRVWESLYSSAPGLAISLAGKRRARRQLRRRESSPGTSNAHNCRPVWGPRTAQSPPDSRTRRFSTATRRRGRGGASRPVEETLAKAGQRPGAGVFECRRPVTLDVACRR